MAQNTSGETLDLCTTTNSLFRPSVLNVEAKITYPTFGNLPASDKNKVSCSISTTTSSILGVPSSTKSAVCSDVAAKKSDTIPGDYVFGSDISSRVINAHTSRGASSNLWTVSEGQPSSESSVFTTLAKAVSAPKTDEGKSCTLEDSVQKVTEDQKNSALNLAQVDVFTGEEQEVQIFRLSCRAYVFDANKQKWNFLGASHFHLNDVPIGVFDSSCCRSRIVVRLVSTRRVIINSSVWREMPVALVDPRSLRIGAVNIDDGHLRNYLLLFPPDESATRVLEALNIRKHNAEGKVTHSFTSHHAPPIVGQKRTLKSTDSSETTDLPANSPFSPSKRSTQPMHKTPPIENTIEGTSQTTNLPKSNLFRPSILGSHNVPSTTMGESDSGPVATSGGVCFRQSALDPVVKRLREDQTVSESPSVHQEEKSADFHSFGVRHDPPGANICLPTGSNTSTEFVFGHNVSERVKNAGSGQELLHPSKGEDFSSVNRDKHISSFQQVGSSQLSESCISTDVDDTDFVVGAPPCELTLQDSASAVVAEMREQSTVPLSELPRPPLLTGEEGECIALKTYCQFYSFDREKHVWIGGGKAYLHLNDIPSTEIASATKVRIVAGPPARSRLVARVCQTLKLLANTPVWPGLNVALADERSIRLSTIALPHNEDGVSSDHSNQAFSERSDTAENSHEIPEFCAYLMVMRSPKEANRLYSALVSRMNALTHNPTDIDTESESIDRVLTDPGRTEGQGNSPLAALPIKSNTESKTDAVNSVSNGSAHVQETSSVDANEFV